MTRQDEEAAMTRIGDLLEYKGFDVYSTSPAATIDEAVAEMCRVKAGALLVRQRGLLVGIVSERDLLIRVLLAHKNPSTTTVSEIMTRDLVRIDLDCSVHAAMSLMTTHRCRHLPVETDDSLVGLVSIGDLVRAIVQEQEGEIRCLHEYVEGRYPG
jgi:CBS domain-containing protein